MLPPTALRVSATKLYVSWASRPRDNVQSQKQQYIGLPARRYRDGGLEVTTMAVHVSGHLEEPPFPDLDRVSTEVAEIADTLLRPAPKYTPSDMNEPLLSALRTQAPLLTEPALLCYATKELLSRLIPETDPDHERAKTFRVWKSRRSTMLYLQILFASITTIANAAFTAWAVSDLYHCSDLEQPSKIRHSSAQGLPANGIEQRGLCR
jgi:hypothetical protein